VKNRVGKVDIGIKSEPGLSLIQSTAMPPPSLLSSNSLRGKILKNWVGLEVVDFLTRNLQVLPVFFIIPSWCAWYIASPFVVAPQPRFTPSHHRHHE
jgi:hypothetical protein